MSNQLPAQPQAPVKKPEEVKSEYVPVPPTEMYCLCCRKKVSVSDVHLIDTSFESKKNKTKMVRKTWLGKCSACGKDVRQFAKTKEDEKDEDVKMEEKKEEKK